MHIDSLGNPRGKNAEIVKLLFPNFRFLTRMHLTRMHCEESTSTTFTSSINKNHDESNTNKSETEEESCIEDIEVVEPDPNSNKKNKVLQT